MRRFRSPFVNDDIGNENMFSICWGVANRLKFDMTGKSIYYQIGTYNNLASLRLSIIAISTVVVVVIINGIAINSGMSNNSEN